MTSKVSAEQHPADRHDLIRVQGAPENGRETPLTPGHGFLFDRAG